MNHSTRINRMQFIIIKRNWNYFIKSAKIRDDGHNVIQSTEQLSTYTMTRPSRRYAGDLSAWKFTKCINTCGLVFIHHQSSGWLHLKILVILGEVITIATHKMIRTAVLFAISIHNICNRPFGLRWTTSCHLVRTGCVLLRPAVPGTCTSCLPEAQYRLPLLCTQVNHKQYTTVKWFLDDLRQQIFFHQNLNTLFNQQNPLDWGFTYWLSNAVQ